MSDKRHFISLKTKIMISTLIPVVISFALITSVIFPSLFNSLHETAKAEILQTSQKYAHNFESKINNAMNYLSILASELEARVEAGADDRETLQKTVLSIFDGYELLDGSSVYFEADMYDGRDADYIGSEYGTAKSGKICWYFYIDEGETAYLPEGLENDIEFELPHYTKAKEENRPVFTDPVAHEIDGKTISMFTLTYPINDSSGNFIGAVTVDLFLDDIYAQLQDEEIYETGYIIICNENERIIYSPNYEDIGKTREEAGLTYSLTSENKAADFFNAESVVNGKDSLVTIESIYIPQLDSDFYISITAPLNEINADGTRLTVYLIIFSVIVVAAIALLLYYLIGKISAPLNEITASVDKIANGEYGARIKGAYKGEFAVVKDSVNTMADSIEAYIEESKNSLNILKNILNGLDAVIYVTVPDTGEILFMNDQMKAEYNVGGDGVGQFCYKVLQEGMNEKCDFCPCLQLDKEPDKAVVWEEHSSLTNRDYRNTDRYIEWIGGRKAHLQHSVDITDIKMAQVALDRRLRQQSLMASISQSFLSDAGIETLITNALRMTGEFIGVEQILFYKLDNDGVSFVCQSEWINPEMGKQSCIGSRQVLPDSLLSYIKSLSNQKGAYLNVNDPSLKAELAPYMVNFQNYISVPIFLKGSLYGALDFFREDDSREWGNSDISLATLVSSLLSGVFERHSMESEMIAAKEFAEQSNRSKSQFLSRMSHEMRTPMNAIIGMTSIAKDSADPAKKEYCLERIDNASRHLLGVINDILDMSKIEANKFDLSYSEFNFDRMLLNVLNVVNDRMEEKHQAFSLFVDPCISGSLIGDEQHLAQVITNLLTNAVKFTPEGGTIQLKACVLSEENGMLTLQMEVIDSGIGISVEQQDRLFRSFEQADGSIARKFGGTGLGLAISKHIVELMGGEIWVESELGRGSSFIFTMKLKKGTDNLDCVSRYPSMAAEESAEEEKDTAGLNSFEGKTALLAEDVDINREIVATVLGDTKLKIEYAENGRQAVEMFAADPGKYDIILMDVHMPEVDGLEATRRIRAMEASDGARVPIVAMTADVFNEDISKCLDSGMDDHIGKPIDFDELFYKLRKYLG